MITLLGSLNEAWTQVRLSKVRVFLSLVGVAVAVAVMAGVIAFGRVVVQAQVEEIEFYSGRPGTISFDVRELSPEEIAQSQKEEQEDEYATAMPFVEDASIPVPAPQKPDSAGDGTDGPGTFNPKLLKEWDALVKRYEIRYATVVGQTYTHVRLAEGLLPTNMQVVDEPFAVMHRLAVEEGRWFDKTDPGKLAPRVVINHSLAVALDALNREGPITITLGKTNQFRAVVVGILPERMFEAPEMYMLRASYEALPNKEESTVNYTLKTWVDPDMVPQAKAQITAALQGKFGKKSTNSYAVDSSGAMNAQESLTRVVGGIGVVVLALGALSLINISVVTVRARIHEIGIRRALGATSTRVFVSIFLESVVATFVAGLAGVVIAVVASQYIPYEQMQIVVQDMPPFPLDAALIGLISATAIGALAGLVPALIAVRVKPIDAIRY
ncbi:MAG: ABC transporter permease [Buchananella hordeovulneris]|nr:ABC transporter permease [Buchananella hordeovulneris]